MRIQVLDPKDGDLGHVGILLSLVDRENTYREISPDHLIPNV